MTYLTEAEKKQIIDLIEKGKPLPPIYKGKLFAPEDDTFIQTTKEYRLVYEGKTRREDVIAGTPEAPFQLVRKFNEDNPFPDDWRNMLIYGDNLLALKELYADQHGPNRYGTRDRIKLIYIDPPFATRADFMKDKEKAYRDKVIGAQFIEFLRRRLILLYEILASDGSIYVHLDWKKGHYIKAVIDEILGEHNFLNDVAWQSTTAAKFQTEGFPRTFSNIFIYRKSDKYYFDKQYKDFDQSYIQAFYKYRDEETNEMYRISDFTQNGSGPARNFGEKGMISPPRGKHWIWKQDGIDEGLKKGLIVFSSTGFPGLKRYLKDRKGNPIRDIWSDIKDIGPQSLERYDYPTQKPEQLLERIIRASSKEDEIVLDCFVGSGTTIAVSEKLGRRWIGIDCGKLAIYTSQKRLFSLTTNIGSKKKDDRIDSERIEDWPAHLKGAATILLVTEKARKGECEITLQLLEDMVNLIKKYNLGMKSDFISMICPQDKLKIPESELEDIDDDSTAGQKVINIKGIQFRISFIEPKHRSEKNRPLKAKEFALFSAGVYDNEAVKQMPWEEYRPFVLKLFQVREHEHFIKGFRCDGYVDVHSAFVWNYPEHKKLTIDYDYVKSIHETLGGSGGEKFYVIAPIVSMGFAEDEYVVGKTTYVFLKVPISILMRLLQSGEIGALKQPTKEADVNEVIDAVGFDFISQPEAQWKCKKERPPDAPLLKDYVIHLTDFRSKTLATDPEDFANFETFSMAMVDTDYDGKTFNLGKVFWANDLIATEIKRLKDNMKGKKIKEEEEHESIDLTKCERLSLHIPDSDFEGKQMMVILCDCYGNEKKLVFKKKDFS